MLADYCLLTSLDSIFLGNVFPLLRYLVGSVQRVHRLQHHNFQERGPHENGEKGFSVTCYMPGSDRLTKDFQQVLVHVHVVVCLSFPRNFVATCRTAFHAAFSFPVIMLSN